MTVEHRLLPETPFQSLADYVAAGGGQGLEALDRMGPPDAIAEIRASGLRGRGGAGFPTAFKLGGVASSDADRKFVVANVSEGEPGTFKDRWMLQNNPYQLLEGITIAGLMTGAEQAFIAIKHKHHTAIDRLEQAAVEMVDAGCRPKSWRFSLAVSFSSTAADWPARPITRRTASGLEATSMPAIDAAPASMDNSVVNILIVVVLPAPFGPRRPVTSPARASKVRSTTASVSPKLLLRPRAATAIGREASTDWAGASSVMDPSIRS